MPIHQHNSAKSAPLLKRVLSLAVLCLLVLQHLLLLSPQIVKADNTPQSLPFSQDWSNTGLITTDDNWSGVPGITGYRGDGLAGGTGVDPQTILGEGTLVVDVNANQTNPNTFTTGGVAEFQLSNPTVALQGSGTARAPYVQFSFTTLGQSGISISYNLRDIDGSADNAVQPVALQYRVGSTGNFTNVPAGFVADATTGPSLATLVTPVSVTLPAAVDNQSIVQVRVITTDAAGSDEWVGIDDVNITSSGVTPTPTPTPTATPTPTPTATPTPTPTPSPTPTPTPGPVNHLVISQIYGGGGNTNATFQNDYVEIYNPTSSPIDTAGWTVQYAAAGGTSWTNNQPLGGVISPGEYFLVSLASGGAVGQPLPQANISGSINMSGTTGKVALVSNGDPLSGSGCPLNDPDIVDFVGYGTTANCFEDGSRAPAPSNTTAIFRNANGAQDTNVNGADFVTGTPNPRRTTPFQEIGPSVITTVPTRDGFNAPKDASPTIIFSEAVTVDPDWFDITCASGQHNDATFATTGGGKTWEITPNVSFTPGEQCTVMIRKDAVHDADSDDSASNTDTLTANYIWSFTVASMAQPVPFSQDIHLVMGNPSNATPNILEPDNYLLQRAGNALSYNRDKGTPNWVSWHLDSSWYGTLTRLDTFRPDPSIPPDWYRVTDFDYSFSGFDRGHMTPNADRDHQLMIPINQETYLMSNMVPQAPDNNQGPWADMEGDLRLLTDAGNELFIVSGPFGVGGAGDNGPATTIANGHVTVPAFTWKVVMVLPHGVLDPNQVTAATKTFAVKMPNVNGIFNDDWRIYKVTVRDIENLTGYNFFSNVPEAVQNSIEVGLDGDNPPGTGNQTILDTEDNSVQFSLNAVNPIAGGLTATTSQPAHGSVNCSDINCTYSPEGNFNGTDSFTFSVSNGSKSSNTSTATIVVSSVNDLPTATNDQTATYPSVQYSDAIQSVSVSASDVETPAGSLIPSETFSRNGGSVQSGLPSGLSLVQTASPGTWTLAGNIQESAGSYSINVTFTDADGGTGSTGITINVTREDAGVTISGPTAVQVSSVGGTSPTFTFKANLADSADGAAGSIANAVPVTFLLSPVGSDGSSFSCNASTITFPSGVPTASCDFTNVAVNVYDITAVIGGSYYQGGNHSVVAVYDPSLGFVTGSGTVTRSVNGETFAADFSVNLKYKKDGTTQGSLSYVEHHVYGDVTFMSNSMGALAVVGNDAKMTGTGTLNGHDSYSFLARFVDAGEPGSNDTFGLRITDSGGTVVADLTFDPSNLSSGNIKVH